VQVATTFIDNYQDAYPHVPTGRRKVSRQRKKIVFPAPMRTEQASNGLYPSADDFPTYYESSSSVSTGTSLPPRRRDIWG